MQNITDFVAWSNFIRDNPCDMIWLGWVGP